MNLFTYTATRFDVRLQVVGWFACFRPWFVVLRPYPACLQHGLCFGLCLSVPLSLVGFWLAAVGFCQRRVFYKATRFAQVTRKQRCLVRQQKATRDAMVFLVATLFLKQRHDVHVQPELQPSQLLPVWWFLF